MLERVFASVVTTPVIVLSVATPPSSMERSRFAMGEVFVLASTVLATAGTLGLRVSTSALEAPRTHATVVAHAAALDIARVMVPRTGRRVNYRVQAASQIHAVGTVCARPLGHVVAVPT